MSHTSNAAHQKAYEIALSMIGDPSPAKLKDLLDVLAARDLLRKQRRSEL